MKEIVCVRTFLNIYPLILSSLRATDPFAGYEWFIFLHLISYIVIYLAISIAISSFLSEFQAGLGQIGHRIHGMEDKASNIGRTLLEHSMPTTFMNFSCV